ncbi:unnamed protein product, partial [marine sediment metagenome]
MKKISFKNIFKKSETGGNKTGRVLFILLIIIIAAGTIDVLGSGDVTMGNEIIDHPLALVAKGNIIIRGSVHGEGVIQTEGNFTNNG